jgi:hypothetical protein
LARELNHAVVVARAIDDGFNRRERGLPAGTRGQGWGWRGRGGERERERSRC